MQEAQTKLRRDAEQNRAKILGSARALFSAYGVDAPLEDVAARAGVGIATLYRRFPSREALLAELFAAEFEQNHQAADAALGFEDPWQGFCFYLERICEMQAGDLGLREALTIALPGDRRLEASRVELREKMQRIIGRAQVQGTLRKDITPEDLAFVAWANSSIVAATASVAPKAWRRFFALILDGLRTANASELPQPPLTQRQLFRALTRAQRLTTKSK